MNLKGINQNVNPESIPDGFIYWAKNGVNGRKYDTALNERGNAIEIVLTSLNILFKNGVIVLGNKIILFYKSNTSKDCIAVIDEVTKTFSLKLERTDFNFNINNPITGEAKLNSKGELIVAFIDGLNKDKYVNLDTVQPSDTLDFYTLFPKVNNASNIQTTVLDSGSVPTGTYFFTFQYVNRDQSKTTWTTISNPTYITNIDANSRYTDSKGTNTNKSSNKSIRVTLSDIDTTYYKIVVALISKVDGVLSSKLIKEVFINTSTLSFVYKGTESLGTVTIDELLTDNVIYDSSKKITTINNQLLLADLKVKPTEDFQSTANLTTIRWTSKIDFSLISDSPYSGSSKYRDGNRKTFIHDEIVAIYQQFELLDGSFTQWYHVPGRTVISGETDPSIAPTGGLLINGRTPKKYEIEDTCTYEGIEDGYKVGLCGYWENENEQYSPTFPFFANQNVRHHKLPSLEFMYNLYSDLFPSTSIKRYGIDCLDFLDIKVTSTYDTTKIKGYRIGYAKKSLSDIVVLGVGLVKFSGNQSGGGSVLINTGGNFAQDCIDDGGGAGDNIVSNKDYLRFNSFDIFQDRPDITSSYLRNYIKLKIDKLGETAAFTRYNPLDNDYGVICAGKDFSDDVDLVSYALNYTKIRSANPRTTTSSTVPTNDKIRKLTGQLYIPKDIRASSGAIDIDNRGSEETIHAKIESTNFTLNTTTNGTLKTKTNGQFTDPNLFEETYLSSLKVPKSDVFLNFDNQIIISNPIIIRTSGVSSLFENIGDGFISVYSFVSLAGYGAVNYLDYNKSVVMFNIHMNVGRHNAGLRYLTIGDYKTYFYPDAGVFGRKDREYKNYWFSPSENKRNEEFNNFSYSKDFSYINELDTLGIFNPININQNDYRFRIIRSLQGTKENALEDGWRTFLALDYLDVVRNKGEIINLEAWGNESVIIHHKRALYRTRDKAILQADIIGISLGSGDIFQIEPKEESPTRTGTGGTQHKYSCLLTDFGYLFVDEETKIVYLYDGKDLKDFGGGLKNFFSDYLNCKKDNPYNDHGIVFAYQNEESRVILSQKADINFTVSYDLIKQQWVYAHDFVPDFMFNTRSNLFSFKNNDLYTHGVGDRGRYYGILYPFYIDFVINDDPDSQKILEVVSWITKYKNTTTSIDQRKTITSITIWNDQGCTGKIPIVTNETESLFVDANAKVVDEIWSFNDIVDNVIDPSANIVDTLLENNAVNVSNITTPVWYDSQPLRGKYFIVRLEFDNIANKELYLQSFDYLIRKSAN